MAMAHSCGQIQNLGVHTLIPLKNKTKQNKKPTTKKVPKKSGVLFTKKKEIS
jgi:hypothetical protein